MQNNLTQKPRVLIVDDDKQNLLQISAALAYLEAEVDTAPKAKEAIYLINSQSYAVMIFDVNLPEMDGFELADIIHSGYANTKTPIIFISGVFFDEMSVFKGYRTGAVDYLTKPLNMNILISKVQVFLDLNNMYNELQLEKAKSLKALEEKTMAIGTVSHEIRNPLSTITGIIDVLETECENSELKTYLHLIKSSSNHMNHLLSDLTDYTKIETGRVVLENISFDLREEVDVIVSSFRFQTNISQNEFTYDINDEVPKILVGDITRFNQIIYNLLGNANKFTREGHIHLSIEVDQISKNSLILLTKVSDNGIGMTEEEQQDLFTPFFQGNTSITRKYGGSGLGLSISKELSKILGGDIHLTSKKGEGSTFSFTSRFKML